MNHHEVSQGTYLLRSVDLTRGDTLYNVQSGREKVNSHHDVLNPDGMADAVSLRERVLRPGTHDHLYCSALEFVQ